MAKIKTTQAELDEIFAKLSREHKRLNERQQAYAVKELGRVRSEVASILAEHSDDDGIVPRRRMRMILRDLDGFENTLRETGEIAIEKIIEDTSYATISDVNKALGVSVSKAQFDRINEYVVRYVIKRFGDDGLVLSDRVWGLSGEIRDEISTVIRSGVIKGESVSSMMPKVRAVYDTETWKIRRLVRTESSTAQRAAISYNAQSSDLVKWVQFHDGTCGRKDHHKHACYALANEDRYGKGQGVYKPNDADIWMPHPNCTSYITYIVDDI